MVKAENIGADLGVPGCCDGVLVRHMMSAYAYIVLAPPLFQNSQDSCCNGGALPSTKHDRTTDYHHRRLVFVWYCIPMSGFSLRFQHLFQID